MPPTRMVCHGTSENAMADLEGNPHIMREPPKYIHIYIYNWEYIRKMEQNWGYIMIYHNISSET